jgi:peroxiredoxin Q/BCP
LALRRVEDRVDVGSKAPNFTLRSQSGANVSLEDFLGRSPVVLFFYPKDDTPGCTKQACAFRDDYGQFGAVDAEVLGISSDSVGSHKSFAENNGLPFVLLSDEGGRVRQLYGVTKTLGLMPGRVPCPGTWRKLWQPWRASSRKRSERTPADHVRALLGRALTSGRLSPYVRC